MTNQSDIKKLAEQMASSMKSFDDIKDFQKQLMQSFIDTALEAEMEEHLGYPKHEKADRPNKRNGHTKKTVRSDTGELEISTPRDRDSSFEPVLVSKHQTRISGLDDKIISFYAKGQTTTEIVETIKDIYDVDYTAFKLEDPYSFTDPRQLYYAPYVQSRAAMGEAFAKSIDYVESRGLLQKLPAGWDALVGEVVDRQHRPGLPRGGAVKAVVLERRCGQGGGPVVKVEHHRLPLPRKGQLHGGQGEEGEGQGGDRVEIFRVDGGV